MLQLHIVHIREDASGIEEAKKYANGVAVLAFFIKVRSQIFNCPSQISQRFGGVVVLMLQQFET